MFAHGSSRLEISLSSRCERFFVSSRAAVLPKRASSFPRVHIRRDSTLAFMRVFPRQASFMQTHSMSRTFSSTIDREQGPKKQKWTKKRIFFWSFGTTYAILSLIPISMTAYAFYCWCKGDVDGTRGGLFFALQGYICLPLSLLFVPAIPFVYLTDWTQRRYFDKLMLLWGRLTCLPFFVPEIFVEKVGSNSHTNSLEKGKPLLQESEKDFEAKPVPSLFDFSNMLEQHLDTLPPELREKGVIYVCNHQSWIDIYALMWLGIPLKFLSKPEILLIPVCGWVMTSIGCIPVYRDRPGDIIQRCRGKIRDGMSIFFFAEGTRTKDGSLGPFKAGAFKIAHDEQAVIVPLTICGTRDMMPSNSFALSSKSCKIFAHSPILPTWADGKQKTVDELMKIAREAVSAPLNWQQTTGFHSNVSSSSGS